MVQLWKKLRLFLGFVLPPEEKQPVVQEAPEAEARASAPCKAAWAVDFDSVVPGMRGQVALPAGPGRIVTVRFEALTVGEIWSGIRQMAEARENWPFGPEAEPFAGYVSLEGPGWHLQAFFGRPAPRVEYYAGRSDGPERVSGDVRWESLGQALWLCPDYDAVVGFLTLNPYELWGYTV